MILKELRDKMDKIILTHALKVALTKEKALVDFVSSLTDEPPEEYIIRNRDKFITKIHPNGIEELCYEDVAFFKIDTRMYIK